PLDYRQPGGRRIDVVISRVRSAKPAARRGVLLLNPGGPGGSGLALPVLLGSVAPQGLLDSYDLIGFDPRGVGMSTPVGCGLTDEEKDEVYPWPLPGGVPANTAVARRIADKCGTSPTGGLMPFVTTANTARDMDVIREALGEARISYYGISYGTYLGAVYASLFPERTDRFVLDSALDPAGVWSRTLFRAFGPGAEIRFPDFAKWAAAHDAAYGLGATPEAVRANYFSLAAKLDAQPQNGFTGNMFRQATFTALYADDAFPMLAETWRRAELGTLSSSGGLDPPSADNLVSAQLAVLCGDTTWPVSPGEYEHDVRVDGHLFPLVGAMAAGPYPCAVWPTPPLEPAVPVTSNGPANILVVNNLRDPATPYSGAVSMARALGDRAWLVTVDHGGHGAAYLGGPPDPCAGDTATRWLVDGKPPSAAESFCAAGDQAAEMSPARHVVAAEVAKGWW
ncbi:MAG TPA: alpha/beta hydrolase, partial [Amycolatopsis sp.]|uniref:alpha/beta hydrolase n=1 Tax=Amycolatopsis sp. TaxID=37632 RepID=UPI002B47E3E6